MKARILIVDDEQCILKALSRHFRYLRYDIDTANNGQEALDKLADSKFDVVISDIQMPVMSGVDLLRRIRKEYPMIRTIMTTGYVTLENGLACLRQGADTVIFKPIEDLTELEEAVKNAVRYLEHWQEKLKMLRELKRAPMLSVGENNG